MRPDRRLVALQLAAGLAICGFGWGTSLAGVEPVRGYWFDFVWAGYILAGDAVVWRRAGRSLLHGGGWRVAALFALSAPLWWAFEIANWRLENWRYVGTSVYGDQAHVLLKTLSFVFVLPALATSRDLLRSFVRFPNPPAVRLPSWVAPVLVVVGLACVPLLDGDRLLGVLEAVNKNYDREFTDDDHDLLMVVAHLASLALVRADSFSEQSA